MFENGRRCLPARPGVDCCIRVFKSEICLARSSISQQDEISKGRVKAERNDEVGTAPRPGEKRTSAAEAATNSPRSGPTEVRPFPKIPGDVVEPSKDRPSHMHDEAQTRRSLRIAFVFFLFSFLVSYLRLSLAFSRRFATFAFLKRCGVITPAAGTVHGGDEPCMTRGR